jgi:hypothetical protein
MSKMVIETKSEMMMAKALQLETKYIIYFHSKPAHRLDPTQPYLRIKDCFSATLNGLYFTEKLPDTISDELKDAYASIFATL